MTESSTTIALIVVTMDCGNDREISSGRPIISVDRLRARTTPECLTNYLINS